MVVIDRKILMFKYREIYFSDYPYDLKGCDGVEFWLCKNKVEAEGFVRTEAANSIIDLTQDLDTIWKNMASGNCRKPIRRAERAGVKVKLSQNYDEFYQIFRSCNAS